MTPPCRACLVDIHLLEHNEVLHPRLNGAHLVEMQFQGQCCDQGTFAMINWNTAALRLGSKVTDEYSTKQKRANSCCGSFRLCLRNCFELSQCTTWCDSDHPDPAGLTYYQQKAATAKTLRIRKKIIPGLRKRHIL
jgi:hypothetical protein